MPMGPGCLAWLGILLTIATAARGAPAGQEFRCHPVAALHHAAPLVIHGNDPLTRNHRDDLLWAINANRMNAARSFILAEIGCGAGCIRLASIDARGGNVRWLPETISSWPMKMRQPVRARNDSRLVVIFGQLDEHGSAGPFFFLLDARGFHPLPRDRVSAPQ